MSDRRRALRAGAVACALGLVILGAALAPAQAQDELPVDVPLADGDFAGYVGIGDGRRLYLECHGAGSPTVILEAGLRSRSDFWSERTDETVGQTVFPGIARFTRVCAYDRPGTTLGTTDFSRSDPVPMPRTARDAVADLRALIKAAPIPGPHVLVGHSTGGLIVRMYASLYPKRVAGLVLVDALSEFLRRGLTPDQLAAYDELNNGPLPGLEQYTDLEQILFRPSFEQMTPDRAPASAPRDAVRRHLAGTRLPAARRPAGGADHGRGRAGLARVPEGAREPAPGGPTPDRRTQPALHHVQPAAPDHPQRALGRRSGSARALRSGGAVERGWELGGGQ